MNTKNTKLYGRIYEMNEFKQMFIRWNDFSGKSTVREYWMVWLINILISAVLQALGQLSGFFGWVSYIYGLVILVPSLALLIRRLHDTGKSGWYILWLLVPVVGWILLLIALIKQGE